MGVEKNLKARDHEVKDEPDVDHLDVGCSRETTADAQKQGDQDKHCCDIYGDSRFKEKRFKETCIVADDD